MALLSIIVIECCLCCLYIFHVDDDKDTWWPPVWNEGDMTLQSFKEE